MTECIDDASERFPREPWTLLKSLTRHARSCVAISVLATLCAFLAARHLVREHYAAEAVLLFTPVQAGEHATAPARLESRRDLVEVLPNLREVIRRRGLGVTPAQLDAAVEARVHRGSNVLEVEARWTDPQTAADVANELCALFLTQQAEVRHGAMRQVVADLERQQALARKRLHAAADALGRFQQERGALALDDQIRTTIADVSALQSQLDQVTVERENLRRQRANLPAVVDRVVQQLTKGQLGRTDVRAPDAQAREVSRLRSAIEHERHTRERATVLASAKSQLERAQRLSQMGLIPRSEVIKAELEHRRARDAAVETPTIAAWRREANSLEKAMAAPTGAGGASAALAPEVGLRSFQIELDSAAIDDKRKYLEGALARARARLASYAPLQRSLFDLQTATSRHERELAALEEPLAQARRAATSDASEFQVVSRAQPDPQPVTRRKLVAFAAVSGLLMALYAALVLLTELRQSRVRSGRELAYLSHLPVFAQLRERDFGGPRDVALESIEEEVDLMARLSRRLEQGAGPGPVTVLITGSVTSAVRQKVVDGLLAQYILQGRRVAWISLIAEDRPGDPASGAMVGAPSIHDYLRGEGLPAERLLGCLETDAVALIGGSAPVAPHLRSSQRMIELVRRATGEFDLVVLIGDSLVDSPDEMVLARECSTVVLLAQADRTSRVEAERLARLARDANRARAGWVLLGVHPDFEALEAERTQ